MNIKSKSHVQIQITCGMYVYAHGHAYDERFMLHVLARAASPRFSLARDLFVSVASSTTGTPRVSMIRAQLLSLIHI